MVAAVRADCGGGGLLLGLLAAEKRGRVFGGGGGWEGLVCEAPAIVSDRELYVSWIGHSTYDHGFY